MRYHIFQTINAYLWLPNPHFSFFGLSIRLPFLLFWNFQLLVFVTLCMCAGMSVSMSMVMMLGFLLGLFFLDVLFCHGSRLGVHWVNADVF